MAKFRGTVIKSDLEGGLWELETEDGDIYQLQGGDAALRKEGLSVEVTGKVDEGVMGIGMTGPTLAVASYKILG